MSRLTSALFGLTLILSAFATIGNAEPFGTVTFAFDSDQLDSDAQRSVERIAAGILARDSDTPTVVVGYTDAVGSPAYNDGLGLRRAETVAAALRAAGVPVSRIGAVESRGETELLIAVSTPEQQNRRVRVGMEDILAACRSYRTINLTEAAIGDDLQNDLTARLEEAAANYRSLALNGQNGAAFQMAGAARQDCGQAVSYRRDALRKREYAQRCLCNSARMRTALGL